MASIPTIPSTADADAINRAMFPSSLYVGSMRNSKVVFDRGEIGAG